MIAYICLLVIILLSSIPSYGFKVEVLKNGSFESKPLHWKHNKLPSGVKARIDNGISHSGSSSLCMSSVRKETKPWFWWDLPISGIKPGNEYIISCHLKGKNIEQRATLYFTSWDKNGKQLLHQRIGEIKNSSDWKSFSRKIKIPGDAERFRLRFAMSGPGTAWLDDVSIKTEPAPVIEKLNFSKYYPLNKAPVSAGKIDWAKVPASSIETAYKVGHAEAVVVNAEASKGLSDLSFSYKAACDANKLYLKFDVKDDVSCIAKPYWEGDSIQFAIKTPNAKETDKSLMDYYAFGVIPRPDRPEIKIERLKKGSSLTVDKIDVKVTKTAEGYSAIVAIPLNGLGIKLSSGHYIRFAAAVNDSDRNKRKWAQWNAGIVMSKDPEKFGYLAIVNADRLFYIASPPALKQNYLCFPVEAILFDKASDQIDFTLKVNGSVKHKKTSLTRGINKFLFSIPETTVPAGKATAEFNADGIQRHVSFIKPMSKKGYSAKLRNIEKLYGKLASLHKTGQTKKLDMAGVKVSLTVADIFLPFIKADINADVQEKVIRIELEQLERVLKKAILGAEDILLKPELHPFVPPVDTYHATLKGNNWYVGDREVYLFGFNQMDFKYLQYLNGLNCNLTELHGGSVRWGFKDGPDKWNEGLFKRISKQMDLVRKYKLKASVVFGHKMPKWVISKYPEIKEVEGHFMEYDINHPTARKLTCEYMTEFAKRTSKYHQIISYDVWNEAAYKDISAIGLKKFRYDMKKKYGIIDKLNKAWKSNFTSFEKVQLVIQHSSQLEAYEAWCRWNNNRVTSYVKEMSKAIKKGNPDAVVNIKISNDNTFEGSTSFAGRKLGTSRHWNGIDRWTLAQILDLHGCDTRPTKFVPDQRYSFAWLLPGMCYDLQRSIAPNKPIFDSEWHGVQTVYSTDINAPAEFLDTALLFSYLRGVSSNIIWWWSRKGTKLNGKWSYGSLLTLPVLLDAFGRNNLKVQRHAPIITSFKNKKPEVCIYFSKSAAIRNVKYIDLLQKAYENLNWHGVSIGFVTREMISSSNEKLLIVPGAKFIPEDTFALLKRRKQAIFNDLPSNWNDLFKKHGIKRKYTCKVPGKTNSFPVEFRYIETSAGTFCYLINLGKKEVPVIISGPTNQLNLTDTLTGQAYPQQITLPKYKVMILKINKSEKSR